MKTIVKFALTCLTALAVAGSAVTLYHMTRALKHDAAYDGITVGKTTKADLDMALGQATSISFDEGYEVWVYKKKEDADGFASYLPFIGQSTFFSPERYREVVVLFHPDGVVKKYRINQARG